MSSTGNKFPASGTSVARGTNTDWTNPGNIGADDTTDATCADAGGTGSDYLVAANFSLGVPAAAVILGVTVRAEASEHTSGTEALSAQLQDDTATLVGASSNQTISGTTKAVYTWGSASSLWSASLTPAIVNDVDFGVRFWFTTTHDIRIDYVTLAVEWAIPAGVGAITITGQTPTVSVGVAETARIVWANFAAPLSTVTSVSIPSGALSVAGQTPSVLVSQSAAAGVGSVVIDGQAPGVSFTDAHTASALAGELIIAGNEPSVSFTDFRTALAESASLILTGFAPSVGGSYTVSPDRATLVLNGGWAASIPPDWGPTLWDEQQTDWDDGTTDWDYVHGGPVGVASLYLAGKVPTLEIDDLELPGSASLILTGATPSSSVTDNHFVAADSGSLVLTGATSVPAASLTIAVDSGALSLDGQTPAILGAEIARITWANLSVPQAPAAISVSADVASLVLTGKTPSIPVLIQTSVASLVITGQLPVSVPSHEIDVFAASDFVTLTWNAVTGATGYKIGMDVDSGAPYAQEFDVGNVTQYTVGPQEGTYYFNVLAYNGGDGPWNTELVWTSGGLHLTGSTPDVLMGGNVAKSPAQADLLISGGQVVAISPLTVDASVGSLVITGETPAASVTANVEKSPDAANLTIAGALPTSSWTDAHTVSVDVAGLTLDGFVPGLTLAGGFIVDVPAANLFLEGGYAVIPTAQVYPYPGAAGRPSRGRGRPKKQRRWILPNGVHVYADADQAFELAQLVTDQPVEVRTEKPKRPVIVKVDDGGYTEAAVVYPVERFGQPQATETYAAQTQIAGTPAITYEVVARMLQAQRRRQRAAAILLLS